MLVQLVYDQNPYQLVHLRLFHELQVIKMNLVEQPEYYQLLELVEIVVVVAVELPLMLVLQHSLSELMS
jgi:hypothetical protein